ncbi:MAG: hypothetical protein QM802_02775 [Agriterribacter sp.]
MDEIFELPVHFNNKDILLPAKLQTWAYGHRILVEVNKQTFVFEPDEERNYRAGRSTPGNNDDMDMALIEAIAESVENLFK